MILAYPHPTQPGAAVLPETGPRRPLTRQEDGGYALTDPLTGHTRHFRPPDTDGDCRILGISDRNGNRVDIDYTPEGAPTAIRHSGGYHLTLTTEAGRVTTLALGDTVIRRYAYTGGNLTAVLNPAGQPLQFAYDHRLRVTSWTDTNNRRYAYTYDDRDRCVAEGGEAGHIALSIAYDGTHPDWPDARVTTLTTAQGAVSRFVVDDQFQVVAEIDPGGGVTRVEYGAGQQPVSRSDQLGNTVRFEHDGVGRPLAIVYPDGGTTRYAYDEAGNPVAATLPDGSTWRRAYDARGNCTAVTDAAGATTRYAYDDAGRLTAITNAVGNTIRVVCDTAGLPVEITDPLGNRTLRRRDMFGRVEAYFDPLGAQTRVWWTVDGRPARRVGPDGGEERWEYDGEGNCVSYTDANGGTTRYEYGHFDVCTARTGPDGVRYEFEHDAFLRLTRVIHPRGLTWEYSYDAAGRLTSEKDFDGRRVSYRHDAAGRLSARTNPAGQTVVFEHDALGRLTGKVVDGNRSAFEYDAAGRMRRATGPGCEIIWERDPVGRILSEAVDGHTTHFRYDAAGRRVGRTTPTGAEAEYGYDEVGRPVELTTSGHRVAFGYDAAGREVERLIGDSLTLTHGWDPTGRLLEQTLTAGDDMVQRRSYTYRPDGIPTGVEDRLRGASRFALDQVGRVTGVDSQDWQETYAYDAAGNQTRAVWPQHHAGVEGQGDRVYRGTQVTRAGAMRYEHDRAGRVMTRRKTRLSRKPDVWHYRWDAEDRLTSATTPDGTVWRYLYDPLGRRTAKRRLGADGRSVVEETRFAWDGSRVAEQTTTGDAIPHPVVLTWDHDGVVPVAQTERLLDSASQEEVDARFFAIVTDLVGSPAELVDQTGAVAWRSRSTLWGVTAWPSDSAAYTPLRFPGQYHDAETGLHYNHHRYYDPETARYLSQDPLGLAPSPNPLAYVVNPHVLADPLGLAPYQRYRTDSRRPDEIFRDGFAPQGDNMNLEEHVAGLGGQYYPESGYVATTESLSHAQDRARGNGGYVYDVRARDSGVDVNAELPGNHSAHEMEHAYPRSIDPSEIAGAWDSSGNYTANPNFGGRR